VLEICFTPREHTDKYDHLKGRSFFMNSMEGGHVLEVTIRPVRDVVKLENGLSIKDLKNLKNNILKAQMASLKEEN
jgi:hypothetical protein